MLNSADILSNLVKRSKGRRFRPRHPETKTGFRPVQRYYSVRIERIPMAATGELIRMMNYVDDIAATLRRINASLYLVTPEEKRRLAQYMRKSDPNFITLVEALEKGE